jgi:hypothetical protein
MISRGQVYFLNLKPTHSGKQAGRQLGSQEAGRSLTLPHPSGCVKLLQLHPRIVLE